MQLSESEGDPRRVENRLSAIKS